MSYDHILQKKYKQFLVSNIKTEIMKHEDNNKQHWGWKRCREGCLSYVIHVIWCWLREESASQGGFSGLKWGLWMRPCVSVISALALLEGFQMQKSGNCEKPKHASEVKKARRPPTHHVLALQLSPSPHLKSMTHACAGYIVRVHQKIPLCISRLPWPALHWQIACVTLEQWSIR